MFGEHLTVEQLVGSVLAEDVDVVGISFSSNAYLDHCRSVVEEMRRQGVAEVPIVVGGLIHPEDEQTLREIGIADTFGPGSEIRNIAESLRGLCGALPESTEGKPDEERA